ncbi:MAG: outer membrane protein [Pseudomonadales bacterium]
MTRSLHFTARTDHRMRTRCALTTLLWMVLLTATQTTRAESDERWYLSFGFGANYGERAELEGPDVKVDYDLGLPRYSGGVARRFGERWWLELEMSQRKTKAEFFYPASGGPSGDPGSNDRYTSASLMASVIREFRLGPWLEPYVGFGLGPTWLKYQLGEVQPGSPDETYLIDDEATALAVQAMAGFRFPLTRSLDLGLEYEYWRTPDVSLEDVNGNDVDLDQTIHSGWLTLYWYPGAQRSAGFGASRVTGDAGRGFYLSGNLGTGWARDSETGPVTFDAFAPGGLLTLAAGHTLGKRWRLEAEYAYRSNEAQLIDYGFGIGERRVDGDLTSSSLGINLWYDLLPGAAVRPSLGIGGGATRIDYDMDFTDGTTFVDDEVSTAFVQVAAGFDIELSRRLTVHTGWRVWLTDSHDVDLADGQTVTADHWVHSAELGLRYQLGQ